MENQGGFYAGMESMQENSDLYGWYSLYPQSDPNDGSTNIWGQGMPYIGTQTTAFGYPAQNLGLMNEARLFTDNFGNHFGAVQSQPAQEVAGPMTRYMGLANGLEPLSGPNSGFLDQPVQNNNLQWQGDMSVPTVAAIGSGAGPFSSAERPQSPEAVQETYSTSPETNFGISGTSTVAPQTRRGRPVGSKTKKRSHEGAENLEETEEMRAKKARNCDSVAKSRAKKNAEVARDREELQKLREEKLTWEAELVAKEEIRILKEEIAQSKGDLNGSPLLVGHRDRPSVTARQPLRRLMNLRYTEEY